MAKIDLIFLTVDAKNKNDPHNPRRQLSPAEFLEGIVRLSVRRLPDGGKSLEQPLSEVRTLAPTSVASSLHGREMSRRTAC